MDWLDIKNNGQVKHITEQIYRGIQCKWVENKGWKIVLGDDVWKDEYLFPCFQDAKHAIDRFHEDIVKVYGGVKIKNK